MFNNNNNFPNSQDFSSTPEQKKIWVSLNNCSEEELLALEYVGQQGGRGISANELSRVLRKEQGVVSGILRRLREPNSERRINIQLLRCTRGRHGSKLHSLKEGVVLEDIQKIMSIKGYNLEIYLTAIGEEQQETEQQEKQQEADFIPKNQDKKDAELTQSGLTSNYQNQSNAEEIVEVRSNNPNEEKNPEDNNLETVHPNFAELLSEVQKIVANTVDAKLAEQDERFAKLEQLVRSQN